MQSGVSEASHEGQQVTPFKDTEGRTWEIAINTTAIKRVREMCDVNLLDIADKEVLQQLSNDLVLLVDVLYCLVKKQADEAGVTDEKFGEALGGDVLDDAVVAFRKELVDFFPKRRRETLRKLLEKEEALEQAALSRIETRLDDPQITTAMNTMIDRELDSALTKLNGSSGNSPE